MKVGFTGTQTGMTPFQKTTLFDTLKLCKATEFSHGDCIGSDFESTEIAIEAGVEIFTIYPPNDSKKRAWTFNKERDLSFDGDGKWHSISFKDRKINVRFMKRAGYMERNKDIVNDCELMIATPKEHQHTLRSGTWMTIRWAWHIKRDITIIPPIVRDDSL